MGWLREQRNKVIGGLSGISPMAGLLGGIAESNGMMDPRNQRQTVTAPMQLSKIGGEGGALGTQALINFDGSEAMGDPMLSSVARRRQRLAGNGMMRGTGTGMLPDKGSGGV